MDKCKSLIVMKHGKGHSQSSITEQTHCLHLVFLSCLVYLFSAVRLKWEEFRTLSKNSSKQHRLLEPGAQCTFSVQRTNPQANTIHPELTPPSFFPPKIICLEDCTLCVKDQGVGECISEDAKVRVELWIHSPGERDYMYWVSRPGQFMQTFRSVFPCVM